MSAAEALPEPELDDDAVVMCPNAECGVPLNASDIDGDGACRYCGVVSDVLNTFVERLRAAAASVAPAPNPDDDEPEYPCELCKREPRMRTLPYCEECAQEQGCI